VSFNSNVTDNQNLKFTVVSAKSDPAGSSFADTCAGGASTDDTGNNNKIAVVADRLIFVSNQYPTSVFQNKNFSVRVSAVDINKNIDYNASNSITLSREDGDGQLYSTTGLTHNLVSGSYTWTDLQYNSNGPFSIDVSANNLSSAVSGSISVTKILSLNDILISQYSPHYSRKSDQYIVLFNNTDLDIDLNGYEIVFSSAGGSSPQVEFSWAESKIIPARKFRLLASNEFVTAGSVSLKKADDIFPSFAEDSGQVALRFTNGGDIIYAMAYGNIEIYKFGLSSSKKSIVSSAGGTYQLTVSGKSYARTGDNNADYNLKAAADISEIPNSFDSALNSATRITNPSVELPKKFKLNQNYPNPFNPTTVISYQLTMLSHVRLKVYDLLGREEATLVDEEKTPGYYTVLFNGQNCASGNYFYKITAGNIELVKKMTLIK
jgi:hypothetical protein